MPTGPCWAGVRTCRYHLIISSNTGDTLQGRWLGTRSPIPGRQPMRPNPQPNRSNKSRRTRPARSECLCVTIRGGYGSFGEQQGLASGADLQGCRTVDDLRTASCPRSSSPPPPQEVGNPPPHTEGRNGDACVFQAKPSNGFVLQVQFSCVVSSCGTCENAETPKAKTRKRRNRSGKGTEAVGAKASVGFRWLSGRCSYFVTPLSTAIYRFRGGFVW